MTRSCHSGLAGPLLGAIVAVAGLTACGRGLPAGNPTPPPSGTNVAPIIVDGGPPIIAIGTVNLPFVTVTICVPGTNTCQTVDHVLLDTGSTGLRIIAEALPATFVLPQLNTATGATALWECLQFTDGYSWGSVRSADVKIADGSAGAQPIQLIGDPAITAAPSDCSGNGRLKSENTVNTFGANGVLGLNVFQYDCDAPCTDPANLAPPYLYYSCLAGGPCVASATDLASQVQNPVYNFATNNNGVAIVMPRIGSAGLVKASGELVLGISTQTNNQLGSAGVLSVDALGTFTTTYKSQTLSFSLIDSGSNALYFNDDALAPCATQSGFFCPAQAQDLSATIQQGTGPARTVNFTVDNLESLSTNNPTFNALPNIGGPYYPGTSGVPLPVFDWGLPFFFGRSVFVGFQGRSAGSTAGPFYAF